MKPDTWRITSAAVTAAALFFLSHLANAMAFAPSETEWATWPPFCQARYTVSGAGSNSVFASRVDPAVVKDWEARLGHDIWYALHHYCGGLVIANRARAERDPRQREFTYRRALTEFNFTLTRIRTAHPMRAEISARKGLLHAEIGENDLAIQHIDFAIQDCPKCAVGYQAKAMLYRKAGELSKAREVLESADAATEGESAEINYFLGLILVDLQEYPAAQSHARRAYELGYPLPGLRDRLARSGHPIEQ